MLAPFFLDHQITVTVNGHRLAIEHERRRVHLLDHSRAVEALAG
ncbi:MAG: hypothetical protein R2849_05520 [Thermomicrobiales bacterium]